MTRTRLAGTAGMALIAVVSRGVADPAPAAPAGLDTIDHIIVLYLENRSFDNLFGLFPGANGLEEGWRVATQTDRDGVPLAKLPPVINTYTTPPSVDPRFPPDLPNQPWRIDDYVAHDETTPDTLHRFYQHQEQIHGGRNDRFVAFSDAGGMTMSYHDIHGTALWKLAEQYTLADNFFQAAFGGSFLNHQWLACACTPVYPDAPASIRAELDDQGHMVVDGQITPDGFAVNVIPPRFSPFSPPGTDPAMRLPPQTAATLGDRLSDRGVSWAWYSGGWNDAEAGRPGALFQYHHQPYAYFARYAPGTGARSEHLKDDTEFFRALEEGTLPAVSFVKPYATENQHPGYSTIAAADGYAAGLVRRVQTSPYWPRVAIVITYDEFGGLWDHAAPPAGDRWGPGSRIPAIVVSPFARKGYVDHTLYDTTSLLKTIEQRYGLEPLTERDMAATPMLNAFDFGDH